MIKDITVSREWQKASDILGIAIPDTAGFQNNGNSVIYLWDDGGEPLPNELKGNRLYAKQDRTYKAGTGDLYVRTESLSSILTITDLSTI